jgi:hypothetical protein
MTATFEAVIETLGFAAPPPDASARLAPRDAGDDVRRWVSGVVTIQSDSYKRSEIHPADESGMALVSITMTEDFSGGLIGTGVAVHIGVQRPGGVISGTGVERIVGSLDGREGSFTISSAAYYDNNNIGHGRWVAVAGSGTGDLVGLRAEGDFTVAWTPNGPVSIYNLAYCFEPAEPCGHPTAGGVAADG